MHTQNGTEPPPESGVAPDFPNALPAGSVVVAGKPPVVDKGLSFKPNKLMPHPTPITHEDLLICAGSVPISLPLPDNSVSVGVADSMGLAVCFSS